MLKAEHHPRINAGQLWLHYWEPAQQYYFSKGLNKKKNPKFVREVALTIIAATIPFQGIYFLIYTFLLENNGRLNEDMLNRLNMASALCQVAAYLSLIGIIALWYSMSPMVGIAFTISAFIAMILVRVSMKQPEETTEVTE